ncbi:hypothetical protein NDU88_006264 [Pleurodeles waltl]|uniref:Uncharacterized protein n=1 Tax=Pleurodeles waltl TaxID=8319 RepID=A0AAV7WE72_PLEWA|nr:hypothetical protein NDU88_006264 [Pleurodeles waltl]
MCLPDRAENKDRQKHGPHRCRSSEYRSISPTTVRKRDRGITSKTPQCPVHRLHPCSRFRLCEGWMACGYWYLGAEGEVRVVHARERDDRAELREGVKAEWERRRKRMPKGTP